MTRTRAFAVVALVGIGLLASACGGGASSTATGHLKSGEPNMSPVLPNSAPMPTQAEVSAWMNLPKSNYCLAVPTPQLDTIMASSTSTIAQSGSGPNIAPPNDGPGLYCGWDTRGTNVGGSIWVDTAPSETSQQGYVIHTQALPGGFYVHYEQDGSIPAAQVFAAVDANCRYGRLPTSAGSSRPHLDRSRRHMPTQAQPGGGKQTSVPSMLAAVAWRARSDR
ncbi:MAG: hypothetical protein M3137_18160 [Actinomycetota bacterium]|nr:hypothetical protein [Actinomycetota bacterium]